MEQKPVADQNLEDARTRRNEDLNAETNAFLQEIHGGPMTFGQMLGALRACDEQSLTAFAGRLGVSRQHLHQIESGGKRVSPERALRFAKALGQSEVYFVQLALQDLVRDTGLEATVTLQVA